MGAWTYISPRIEEALGTRPLYAGRKAGSSPAAGSKAIHSLEQDKLVEDAFSV
jgi:2-oxoglutarate dehydrogenase E1 component